MWIDTGSSALPRNISDFFAKVLKREDQQDYLWVNLESGLFLAMGCDGGWRRPEESSFKLFLFTPTADPFDVTHAILGTSQVNFDSKEVGGGRYQYVRADAIDKVNQIIDAKKLWL